MGRSETNHFESALKGVEFDKWDSQHDKNRLDKAETSGISALESDKSSLDTFVADRFQVLCLEGTHPFVRPAVFYLNSRAGFLTLAPSTL